MLASRKRVLVPKGIELEEKQSTPANNSKVAELLAELEAPSSLVKPTITDETYKEALIKPVLTGMYENFDSQLHLREKVYGYKPTAHHIFDMDTVFGLILASFGGFKYSESVKELLTDLISNQDFKRLSAHLIKLMRNLEIQKNPIRIDHIVNTSGDFMPITDDNMNDYKNFLIHFLRVYDCLFGPTPQETMGDSIESFTKVRIDRGIRLQVQAIDFPTYENLSGNMLSCLRAFVDIKDNHLKIHHKKANSDNNILYAELLKRLIDNVILFHKEVVKLVTLLCRYCCQSWCQSWRLDMEGNCIAM